MSILFLDFDGVLNSERFAAEREEAGHGGGIIPLDPRAIALLDQIVDDTWCNIVITSAHRIGRSVNDLTMQLMGAGFRNCCAVRSMTDTKGPSRGAEVQRWRDARPQLINEPYCILDDNSDFFPGQRLVQTSWTYGLEMKHVQRAKNFLSWSTKV